MKKVEIAGIIFNDDGVTLTSEDRALTIWNPEESEQSFIFEISDISRFSELFKYFNCVALSFRVASNDEGEVDLDFISTDNQVEKLSIGDYRYPVKFRFREGMVYFPALRELYLYGEFPKTFPDLSLNKKLDSLAVQYDRQSFGCWNALDRIRDLNILEYSEDDLRPLTSLRNVERLKIDSGAMRSLNGLENLPKLTTLIIVKAPRLVDLDAIGSASGLLNIQFSHYHRITDWSFLEKITRLRRLDLDVVDSVDFRVGLSTLSYLHARKVKSRGNKRFLLETEGRYDGAVDGVDVKYTPSNPVFLQPLDHCFLK